MNKSQKASRIRRLSTISDETMAMEEHFFCEAPRAVAASDPGPAKLFDNLYAVPGAYSNAHAPEDPSRQVEIWMVQRIEGSYDRRRPQKGSGYEGWQGSQRLFGRPTALIDGQL